MLEIAAPWPSIEVKIFLPNPSLGDSEGLTVEINSKRAMDGTLYTYVKGKNQRRRVLWSFRMTRLKSIELSRFITMYISRQLKIVDHFGRGWVGYITSNPVEFNTSKRGTPGGGDEIVDVEIEFEGWLV